MAPAELTKQTHFLALLDADHRETEAVLTHLEALMADAQWDKALEEYGCLYDNLVKHFALEEQALFAELNGYQTMILMELEHDHLLALMKVMATALAGDEENGRDAEQIQRTFEALSTRLKAHILEEDTGVFPMALQRLTLEEQGRVREALHRLSHESDLDWVQCLERPEPKLSIETLPWVKALNKPISVSTLFESGHHSVKLYQLNAGQSLASHWAGEDTCVLVLSGTGRLLANETAYDLSPGSRVKMTPRLRHSVEAITDLAFLQIRIWPWPNFSKVAGKRPLS